jgi:hypothetical protein
MYFSPASVNLIPASRICRQFFVRSNCKKQRIIQRMTHGVTSSAYDRRPPVNGSRKIGVWRTYRSPSRWTCTSRPCRRYERRTNSSGTAEAWRNCVNCNFCYLSTPILPHAHQSNTACHRRRSKHAQANDCAL